MGFSAALAASAAWLLRRSTEFFHRQRNFLVIHLSSQ
jgi:hypothetical protein